VKKFWQHSSLSDIWPVAYRHLSWIEIATRQFSVGVSAQR
jgi:hypothetical protein